MGFIQFLEIPLDIFSCIERLYDTSAGNGLVEGAEDVAYYLLGLHRPAPEALRQLADYYG